MLPTDQIAFYQEKRGVASREKLDPTRKGYPSSK
jgi:hypothetical protein